MGATSTVTECEWEYIGEGYAPAEANELCADIEGGPPDEEGESAEDPIWEYWYG
jgi:hypothetical protein